MAFSRIVLACLLMVLAACANSAEETFEPPFRRYGVLVRVPDAAQGAGFYERVLGYGRGGEWRNGRLIRMTGAENFFIEQTRGAGEPAPGPDIARAAIAFQTHAIEEAAQRLEQRGARLLSGEILTVGIGRSVRFQDAFGNVHSMVETSRAASFQEPHIYNVGIRIPDAATRSARTFYSNTLGFPLMTEQYYPPSLPMVHIDGALGFVIHENEPTEPEVRMRAPAYLDQMGTILLFTVADIEAARARIRRDRPDMNIGLVEYFELGRRFSFADDAGVVSEVWQLETR